MSYPPYQRMYIEISGKCNARCPWCDRGARNLGFLEPPLSNDAPTFMPPDTFGEILDYVLEHNIISANAEIFLHNWGEPLIHPQIDEIFSILRNNSHFQGGIAFSTNASRCLELNPDVMPKLYSVMFSMPGFSQNSYDFAHKFNFGKITKNIFAMAKDLLRFPNVSKQLSYHIYKHNLTEIKGAQIFSSKINFNFSPTLASFNCMEHALAFQTQTMAPQFLDLAKKTLFLYDTDNIKYMRPVNYTCPQHNLLVLSHDAQLNVGCCSRLNEASDCRLGDIRQLSLEDIVQIRKTSPACKRCAELSLDYFTEYFTLIYQPMVSHLIKKYTA